MSSQVGSSAERRHQLDAIPPKSQLATQPPSTAFARLGRTMYRWRRWVILSARPEESANQLPAIERAIRPPSDLKMTLAGGPVFYADIVKLTSSDLRRAETVAFPIAADVLVLVFGSVIAAGVPLVVGGA